MITPNPALTPEGEGTDLSEQKEELSKHHTEFSLGRHKPACKGEDLMSRIQRYPTTSLLGKAKPFHIAYSWHCYILPLSQNSCLWQGPKFTQRSLIAMLLATPCSLLANTHPREESSHWPLSQSWGCTMVLLMQTWSKAAVEALDIRLWRSSVSYLLWCRCDNRRERVLERGEDAPIQAREVCLGRGKGCNRKGGWGERSIRQTKCQSGELFPQWSG